MSKYHIEFTRFQACCIVEYDDTGRLISLLLEYGVMTAEAKRFLFEKLPYDLVRLEAYKKAANVKVSEVEQDLSFESFWNRYNNKFGKKPRAEKLWELLNDKDRMLAYKYIQKYEQFLIQNPGINKKYPETYLSQRIWEN